ncbi:MAG: TonB-dependent receptor [Bacteroidota bacterium]
MKNKLLIAAILLLLNMATAYSQSITGVVYDSKDKNPLPGVTVYWLGTSQATSTDANGKFKLSKNNISDFRLIFAMLGCKTDTVSIMSDDNKITHEMTHSNVQLSQVEINDKQDGSYISKINPRKTQIVTTTELYKAACCNLSESFETNASVDVSYSDAITGAKQIQLLGLSGIYSQIQTENIPLIRGLASSYGLNYIPGSWMQSIQISKGTSSVINGYESVTGQINIEYKKPANSEKLFVNIYGNDKTRLEANLNVAHSFTEKLSTMLMIHGDWFNKDINKIDSTTINAVNTADMSLLKDSEGNQIHWKKTDNFLDIPKLTTINVFNRWDYINPNHFVSRFGIKYMYEDRSGGTTDFNKKDFVLDTAKINNMTLPYGFGMKTSRAEAFWKNGFMFKGKPYKSVGLILSGIYHDQKGYYGVNHYMGIEKSLYGNLIYQSIFGNTNHKFSTGVSFLYDDYIENYQQIQFTYIYQTLPAGSPVSMHDVVTLSPTTNLYPVIYNLNRSEAVGGAFFEYTLTNADVFSFIIGLRADYSSRYGLFFTPRTNLKVQIAKGLQF